ncbi:hypothetical protein GCM10012284_07510 [Mangrovihabitans endophyticus]|uniref:Uncharacterized protein n=1 Tax=Mangrovihabitans endophyticus TaxID=1751298 RepID=A0A8J3BT63_9ACTN|nr:hypothetical protein GCM10012284_07510 [Mangrovihabitans endophyticus]
MRLRILDDQPGAAVGAVQDGETVLARHVHGVPQHRRASTARRCLDEQHPALTVVDRPCQRGAQPGPFPFPAQ